MDMRIMVVNVIRAIILFLLAASYVVLFNEKVNR